MSSTRTTKYIALIMVFVACFAAKATVSASNYVLSDSPRVADNSQKLPPKNLKQTISELYAQAIIAQTLDSLDEKSTDLYNQILEIDSTHAPSLYQLAYKQLKTNPAQAESYVKRAIASDSTQIKYLQVLASIYAIDNRYEQAIQTIERINAIDPNLPNNYLFTSSLYLNNNMPYAALTVIDSAQSRFGKSYELCIKKRDILIGLNLVEQAKDQAQTIATDFSFDINNLRILAELYAQLELNTEAEAAYNQALYVEPNEVNVLLSLCNYYYQHKKDYKKFLDTFLRLAKQKDFPLDGKIDIFNKFIKKREMYQGYYFEVNNIASTIAILYPEDKAAVKLYTTHLVSIGQQEQAITLHKNMLANGDKSLDTYTTIIDLESYVNRVDSVDKYSLMALKTYPKNYELYIQRAVVLQYMKEDKQATKALAKAIKLTDSDSVKSTIYGYLGDIHQALLDDKRTLKSYDKALEYDSLNILVLNNYSYYLSVTERELERALEMSEKVLATQTNNPTYLDTKAWILYKLGEYQKAQEIMRRAISLDKGNNVELFIHYGDILYALGKEFMAETYWQKALENGYDKTMLELHIENLKQTPKH